MMKIIFSVGLAVLVFGTEFALAGCGGACGGCGGPGFCWMKAAMIVGWFLLTSGLLFLTWNNVIAAHTKMKKGKFWQALLVVLTIGAFMTPKFVFKKKGCHKGSCAYSQKGHSHGHGHKHH